MPNRGLCIAACLVSFVLAGCLEFGKDTDLVAPKVEARHLARVTSATGIAFPAGTKGLGYLYDGSGIDDRLALKAEIPTDKKAEFLRNAIFVSGDEGALVPEIGTHKAWWKPASFGVIEDRSLSLPDVSYVRCTFGTEAGKLIAYISWFQI